MGRFFAYANDYASNKDEQGKKAKTAEEAKKKILNLLNTTGNQIEDILNSLKANFDLYYKNNTSFRSDFCDFYDYYQGNARSIVYNLAYHPERYKKGLLYEMAHTSRLFELSTYFERCKGEEKDSLFEEIKKNGWENKRKILRIIFCYLNNKSSLTSRLFQLYYSSDHCNGEVGKLSEVVELYAEHYQEIKNGQTINVNKKGETVRGKLDGTLLKEGTMFNTLVEAQRKRMKSSANSHSIND